MTYLAELHLTKNGKDAGFSYIGIHELMSIVAHKAGFVDVDIDCGPNKCKVTCSDYRGTMKATFTGKDIKEACDKLVEALWQ